MVLSFTVEFLAEVLHLIQEIAVQLFDVVESEFRVEGGGSEISGFVKDPQRLGPFSGNRHKDPGGKSSLGIGPGRGGHRPEDADGLHPYLPHLRQGARRPDLPPLRSGPPPLAGLVSDEGLRCSLTKPRSM